MSYQIITDATADLPLEILEGMSNVVVIPMEIRVGERVCVYGGEDGMTSDEFFAEQEKGAVTSTAQINPFVYRGYFTQALEQGKDILYVGFSSEMSGSFSNALISAEELREEYPERKIICVDTLCASLGEALLLREAASRQQAGMDIDALAAWLLEHRGRVCHWFTVDTLEYLWRGGRVSSAAAIIGTALQIKPLLHVSPEGRLEVSEKLRGRNRALKAQFARLQKGWRSDISPVILIGHGAAYERAVKLKEMVLEEFPTAKVYIAPIGLVIASHTGPGLLLLTFWGDER